MRRFLIVLHALPPAAVIGMSAAATERVGLLLGGGLAGVFLLLVAAVSVGAGDRRGWPPWGVALAGLAVVVSVLATHWPLRAAYALSRPARLGPRRYWPGNQAAAGSHSCSPAREPSGGGWGAAFCSRIRCSERLSSAVTAFSRSGPGGRCSSS